MSKSWNLEGHKKFDDSELANFGPVKFVWLRGSSEARLTTYGELHKLKVISKKPVEFYGDRIFLPAHDKKAAFVGKQLFALWNLYGFKDVPKEIASDLKVLYKFFGRGLMQRAIALPDLATSLNAMQGYDFGRKHIPEMGCTSVAKKEGEDFFYGRNLDFDGTGVMDSAPSVVVHLPRTANQLKYASFTADSMPMASINGVNEAGLTLALHKSYADINGIGAPILCIGELVMRHARNIDEAIEILRKHRPGPAWTFVITDLNKKTAVAVETSKKCFAVRYMEGGQFVQTNHFLNEDTRPYEFSPQSTYENSLIRYDYCNRALKKEEFSGIDSIFDMLAYQSHEKGELSAFHDVIKPSTLQTFAFANENGKIVGYFSGDKAPSASGDFVKFDLDNLWKGALELNAEHWVNPVDSEKRRVQVETAVAFAEYFDFENDERTLEILQEQTSVAAVCLKAICLYNLRRFAECLALIEANLDTDDQELKENLIAVQLMAMTRSGEGVNAVRYAQELSEQELVSSKLKAMVNSFHENGQVVASERRLRFDFSSGQILSKAERPAAKMATVVEIDRWMKERGIQKKAA